jgi:hypothetical protein
LKKLLTIAATLLVAASGTARAGLTVDFGPDQIVNTGVAPFAGAPGFTGPLAGNFSNYVPDTPYDPQITGGDLSQYHYSLTNNTIFSVTGNVVDYRGDYEIYYNNPTIRVSGGTFDIVATFGAGNTATLLGSLTQTQGPNNPNFRDLSYGGHPVTLTGTYTGNAANGGLTGTIQGTLRQDAVATPEPATVAMLVSSLPIALGVWYRNRRRPRRA